MAKNFNHPKVVEAYDDHIRCLIPGYELVHLQIKSILRTQLSANAKILIAGCGTGYELEYLLETFPEASFFAFDPSEEMINKTKARLKLCDLAKIEFKIGDSSVLDNHVQEFDAALAILVSHFLNPFQKKQYFKEIQQSLKQEGFLMSFDLMQFKDQVHIQQLKYLTENLGLSQKQSQMMVERLEDDFELISIQDMQQLLRNCGFHTTECFTQISNFYGVIAYQQEV